VCLALALIGSAAGPLRGKPRRHVAEPAPEPPPGMPVAVSTPAPPSLDELRLGLLAVRRAMRKPPESPAEAST